MSCPVAARPKPPSGPPPRPLRPRRARFGGGIASTPASASQRAVPTRTSRPSTVARTPPPGTALNAVTGTASTSSPSLPARRTMADARGCSLPRSAAAAPRVRSTSPRGVRFLRAHEDLGQLGPPTGQGSGLVQHHDPDVGRALHGRAVADQEAGLCPHAGADHQGGGGGQAHGAGAGDDQHADGAGQGQRQPRLGAEEHPGAEGQGGHDGHGGHEPGDHPVDRPLDRCLGPLGVLHQPSDLGQGAYPAPIRSVRTVSVPVMFRVAPVTRSPGPFSTGTDSPLSIDSSTALAPSTTTPSTAIRSPGRTRTRSPIPDLVRPDLRLGAVPDDAGRGRLAAEQGADGAGRLALGPGLEPPADQDEADDDGRGLVERVERQTGGHRAAAGNRVIAAEYPKAAHVPMATRVSMVSSPWGRPRSARDRNRRPRTTWTNAAGRSRTRLSCSIGSGGPPGQKVTAIMTRPMPMAATPSRSSPRRSAARARSASSRGHGRRGGAPARRSASVRTS